MQTIDHFGRREQSKICTLVTIRNYTAESFKPCNRSLVMHFWADHAVHFVFHVASNIPDHIPLNIVLFLDNAVNILMTVQLIVFDAPYRLVDPMPDKWGAGLVD